MPAIRNLFARTEAVTVDDAEDSGHNKGIINGMIVVLCLFFFALILSSILLYLRRAKQQKQMMDLGAPPAYKDVQRPGHLTIQTTDMHGRSSVLVFGKDGEPMLANPLSPPHSPDNVPQIRITFPDEQDDTGKMQNGRVVVVRMGETSVGLEPLDEEQLPVYEKENNSQFYSIDMEKIGGLKEKDNSRYL
ncbi:uncharacterized protein DNG_05548 [Cephalotrichum gorgonifer]|uniref:Uncharacterized protein n=1 Tax=Cephalotrichum gorgonifer TaxID=2041049 RepID=A0AAE8MYE9_9PEZI|nr:uncharacterized protein DNG_05548 [Cephalotrichum gorgonifer]